MAEKPETGGLPAGSVAPALEGEKYPDSEVIWGGPAFFVNRSWAVHTSSWIRFSFAEQGNPDEPAKFRTAVAMPPAEAIAFLDMLQVMLQPYKDAFEAFRKANALPEQKDNLDTDRV